jgi:hypothetical protein
MKQKHVPAAINCSNANREASPSVSVWKCNVSQATRELLAKQYDECLCKECLTRTEEALDNKAEGSKIEIKTLP